MRHGTLCTMGGVGACRRPKAQAMAQYAQAVILAHPAKEFVDQAREFGYGLVYYLGPPPQWRADYEATKAAIERNIRTTVMRLAVGASSPSDIRNGDVIIGYIGGKEPNINNKMLVILCDIARENQPWYNIAFGKHPRERAEKPEDEEHFQEAFLQRGAILSEVNHVVTDGLKGADIVGLADIMVYASGATNSISGAMLQRPQIYYEDDDVRARMKVQQNGNEHWFVADLGGVVKTCSPSGLSRSLNLLFTPAVKEVLAQTQAKNFPVPVDWDTETKIIRFLENLTR